MALSVGLFNQSAADTETALNGLKPELGPVWEVIDDAAKDGCLRVMKVDMGNVYRRGSGQAGPLSAQTLTPAGNAREWAVAVRWLRALAEEGLDYFFDDFRDVDFVDHRVPPGERSRDRRVFPERQRP